MLAQEIADRHDIAERLRHFLVLDAAILCARMNLEHAVMHPEARELFAGQTLSLRDLILVVREHQVVATAMDVDLRAQLLEVHRRALDMPARSAITPRAGPERLAGLGRFPERKIGRILLALVNL